MCRREQQKLGISNFGACVSKRKSPPSVQLVARACMCSCVTDLVTLLLLLLLARPRRSRPRQYSTKSASPRSKKRPPVRAISFPLAGQPARQAGRQAAHRLTIHLYSRRLKNSQRLPIRVSFPFSERVVCVCCVINFERNDDVFCSERPSPPFAAAIRNQLNVSPPAQPPKQTKPLNQRRFSSPIVALRLLVSPPPPPPQSHRRERRERASNSASLARRRAAS